MKTGDVIKKIREDLDITQGELACQGICRSQINKIENNKVQLSYKLAWKLSEKIKEIQKDKNIALDYEVTTDFLLGTIFFDKEKLIANLEKNINESTIGELDNALKMLVSESDSIELLTKALEIFNKDIRKNQNYIISYSMELLKYDLKTIQSIDCRMDMIRVFNFISDYENSVAVGKAIKDDIQYIDDDEKKTKYYYNMSCAYYQCNNYTKSKEMIILAKEVDYKPLEIHVLTAYANTEVMAKNYESAIKLYTKIIKKTKNVELLANSYSNIAHILTEQNKMKKAYNSIEKAYKYINEVGVRYKFNILINKLSIESKLHSENLEDTFQTILPVLSDFDNVKENQKAFKIMFDYYKESKENTFRIIEKIKGCNLEIEANLLIDIIKKFTIDENIIKVIF